MNPVAYKNAACVKKWWLFDSVDLEDAEGNLIGEHYEFEDTAKALCADCPVFDLCKTDNWKLKTGIVAGARPDERRKRGQK